MKHHSLWHLCLAVVVTLFAAGASTVRADTVDPGYDLFQTFGPTNFQGVNFTGVPLGTYNFGSGPVYVGNADTIVQRQSVVDLPGIGSTGTTPIQLKTLQLKNTAGPPMFVTLDPANPSLGQMTITETTQTGTTHGGTFDSFFDVFFDVHTGSLTGPIVSSGNFVLSASACPWSNVPPTGGVLINGVNHDLDGLDTNDDFYVSGPCSHSHKFIEHTVTFAKPVKIGLESIVVSPGPSVSLTLPAVQQFTVTANDQFGNPIVPPPPVKWSIVPGGAGYISSTGLYHGGAVPGTANVKAVSDGITGTSAVTLSPAPVTVVKPAIATPNPVTGTTTKLYALGGYTGAGGAASLDYSWAATPETVGTSGVAAPETVDSFVSFSDNNDTTAKNTTATFFNVGTYLFTVTIKSPVGTSTTSTVTVTVNQKLTAIVVSPGPTVTLTHPATQQFTATANDQFGKPMSSQPKIGWTLAAGSVGSVAFGTGLYKDTSAVGSATVKAGSGGVTGTSTVTVN